MANEIYSKSWWGSGVCFNTVGWGLVYKPYAQCGAVPALLLALETRATYYENETCTIATLEPKFLFAALYSDINTFWNL